MSHRKPNLHFFVPGFSKCGTTTLCSLLADHPELYIPPIKEPNFFAMGYHRGWDWYTDLFQDAGDRKGGEGSTFYTAAGFEDQVIAHLKQHYPDAKFMFIARDPIKRIESSYREHHHSGYKYGVHVPHDLEATLRAFDNIIADSSYWARLGRYRAAFDPGQIHVLFFEDLLRDQSRVLAECFRFLGVDPEVKIQDLDRKLNPGSAKRYDSPHMRWIHTNRYANKLWKRLPASFTSWALDQDWMRRRFQQPVAWSGAALAFVQEKIGDDAHQFLSFCEKPSSFWPIAESCEQRRVA